jgi:hypothetical protein
VKGNTAQKHMNQIRNYSKKPPDVSHSPSHGLENVSSMRGYLKAAENTTEDGQTSNSQVSGNNENNHASPTDDLGNQRLGRPSRDIKMSARFADFEL